MNIYSKKLKITLTVDESLKLAGLLNFAINHVLKDDTKTIEVFNSIQERLTEAQNLVLAKYACDLQTKGVNYEDNETSKSR